MPNDLAACSSPYLRQHADNPVAWVPWSAAAFAEAARRDVPVLVSIGYSTCHWCHVMAHESFEDQATAEEMNRRFVCIKVDREEHPEVDHIYMDAVQALTGHGGWPLNAFVTAEGQPFYACTYLPRERWQQLGAHLHHLWTSDRPRVLGAAAEITAHLHEAPATGGSSFPGSFPADAEQRLVQQIARAWDAANPGFGWNPEKAPKFPPSQFLNLAVSHENPELSMRAEQILEALQDAGVHDRVGGGFHRYSVDAQWRLPHFEKMLYDNAQLICAFARHGRTDFLQTAINAGDYLLRDLRIGNAYAAAEDADDPDGEGSFYAWSPAQLITVLGPDLGQSLAKAWNITPGIRHSGHHGPEPVVSHIPHPRGAPGPKPVPAERAAWEPLLPRLRAARDQRPRPGRDDKLLTDQNALALEAFAWLGRRTGEARFIDACRELAAFLRTRHSASGLLRLADRPAYITDYGAFVCGMCAAFDLLGDPALIDAAAAVADEAVARLRCAADLDTGEPGGGFFTTPAGREDLIRRCQEHSDNAWPGGEAQLALGFVRLWNVTGEPRWRSLAEGIFAAAGVSVANAPTSSCTLLNAWRQLQSGPRTAVVCGTDSALSAAARSSNDPRLAIIPVATCRDRDWACLEGRTSIDRAQVLVCIGTTCLAPAYAPSEVVARMALPASPAGG